MAIDKFYFSGKPVEFRKQTFQFKRGDETKNVAWPSMEVELRKATLIAEGWVEVTPNPFRPQFGGFK